MELSKKTILVTGANRGIGEAIVRELLKHDVAKIYAAARNVKNLPDFGDKRVVPLALDITDRAQITKATAAAGDIDLLINNAGVLSQTTAVASDPKEQANDMNVNYFGTLSMMHAFAPILEKKRGGAIANVVSVVGLASIPTISGYSASKAALFSATQAARAELAPKGINVIGIFPGPIDTDMTKGSTMELASTESTAKAIADGLLSGAEDIYPDPMSQQVSKLWAHDPKALEKQFAAWV